MKWGEAVGVLLAWGLWRGTGAARPGAVLARALGSGDETNRTLAGMLLVRGGQPALPLLRGNLQAGFAVPMTLRILGDIGGAEVLREIEPYRGSADAAVSRAADDALRAAAHSAHTQA
jgi:hypothetical protein